MTAMAEELIAFNASSTGRDVARVLDENACGGDRDKWVRGGKIAGAQAAALDFASGKRRADPNAVLMAALEHFRRLLNEHAFCDGNGRTYLFFVYIFMDLCGCAMTMHPFELWAALMGGSKPGRRGVSDIDMAARFLQQYVCAEKRPKQLESAPARLACLESNLDVFWEKQTIQGSNQFKDDAWQAGFFTDAQILQDIIKHTHPADVKFPNDPDYILGLD
mmetsp:Transcript_92155/g.264133  ORF Transcript_92155/g.264133 Transcript_92155/m.264133 type:complete len:220 (-) Transcript_92155:166-825(-)|eukprot:CAMPEP_0177185980 /NCGR_PEP_ID=MMETSP0367-20130122/18395_1 /TAXON_ID=447022 ORGANISM="Scrippsiella hangoei-like, Strain SHHI-4" /NCGR_SAMPLE_ID=MMETSP0367 /ASSEMBLY_ACC=CAM_ASM_000362 /LENGTH=219 /DNA_ID=CAMNT_0018633229 /DNA_START=85 /DNA_END=744 /DNA_ORIENTATION=+